MRAFLRVSIGAALLITACEDGPTQLFKPNDGDIPMQNGFAPAEPWVAGDTKSYEDRAGGDSIGRAQFCEEEEKTAQIQVMVNAPIIPDMSVGTVPLTQPDGKPLLADDLLGNYEDGKLCDPTGVYANAFTYGPLDELIIFFNQETRLVEGLMAYTSYLGSMTGKFTEGGREVDVVIRPRERLVIDGRELDQYTSRADQADKPNAWLNYMNVTRVYKMVRETFFNAAPFPDDFDCVTAKICNIIYTASSEATPQVTAYYFPDSGVEVDFTPDGHITLVYLMPVNAAPFETQGAIAFGPTASPEMQFSFASQSRPSCQLTLEEEITFGQFKSRCIDQGDERTLARVSYQVEDARDAVGLEFNGIDLAFIRRGEGKPLFKDGEAPADDDILYSIGFFRTLNATVEEFKPRTLANLYKAGLEQRLRDAVIKDGPIPREMHPFALFEVAVPSMTDAPQAIGEVKTLLGGINWVPQVGESVLALYYSLPPEEQDMLDPRVLEPVFLIEPFVDGVLQQFSHGESERPDAFKAFRTTDDRRWSIGRTHFIRDGVPYRVQAQYSLNYGAITAVFVERGGSDLDQILADVNEQIDDSYPYYRLSVSNVDGNPYGLGGGAITVKSFDRRLNTVTADLSVVDANGAWTTREMTILGDPAADRNGYFRQIRGERYEFVPADIVKFYGKESSFAFYVDASDGLIGRVDQNSFKGALQLCPGLSIRYGDDVRRAVEAWSASVPLNDYRTCDIVYNYSINGNVLDSVASLSNRRAITVLDGRAVSAYVWR